MLTKTEYLASKNNIHIIFGEKTVFIQNKQNQIPVE